MTETLMETNNTKYITRSGRVLTGSISNPTRELENTLNNLSEMGYTPINITQQFVPGMGWVFSLVAKR